MEKVGGGLNLNAIRLILEKSQRHKEGKGMNKDEKRCFIEDLTVSVAEELTSVIDHMPVGWGEPELRQYVADSFHGEMWPNIMKGVRLDRYHEAVNDEYLASNL